MLTRALIVPLTGTMLLLSPALAQNPWPFPNQTLSAPTGPTEFPTQEKPGEWRASKLRGLEVYNENNQRVGEIRDILVDRNGEIDVVVIGIGGFLGFDEHDVALPFDQISWSEPRDRDGVEAPRSYPAHAVVKMTKDQLQAFPEFHYAR